MSGHFVRSSMKSETIPVTLVIENFSLHVSRGFYEGPEFQSKQFDSRWKFVVYASEGDLYGDFLDIRLRRENFKGRDQFVKVKLSVIDCLGSGWVSREVQLCYSGSETRQVLSVSRCDPLNKDVPFQEALYRLNKKRLLPNDTLTVKGEIVIYEEFEAPFSAAEEFENNMNRNRSNRLTLALLAAKEWFLFFMNFTMKLLYTLTMTLMKLLYAAKVAFSYLAVPTAVHILWPLVVFLSKALFNWLKCTIVECVQNRQKRQRPNNTRRYSHDQELIPLSNQNVAYVQAGDYFYMIKRMGKRKQHYYADDYFYGSKNRKQHYYADDNFYGSRNRYLYG